MKFRKCCYLYHFKNFYVSILLNYPNRDRLNNFLIVVKKRLEFTFKPKEKEICSA